MEVQTRADRYATSYDDSMILLKALKDKLQGTVRYFPRISLCSGLYTSTVSFEFGVKQVIGTEHKTIPVTPVKGIS